MKNIIEKNNQKYFRNYLYILITFSTFVLQLKIHNTMAQFNVTNIVWDTDDEDLDLPTEEFVECDGEDSISDTLSDMYGWCVESYSID
jgi:hypothetical protein